MADVGAESMVGGTTFHREMIQREISRALVLNLSGKASGATALPRIFLSLTAPSLLSRPTRPEGDSVHGLREVQEGDHASVPRRHQVQPARGPRARPQELGDGDVRLRREVSHWP